MNKILYAFCILHTHPVQPSFLAFITMQYTEKA